VDRLSDGHPQRERRIAGPDETTAAWLRLPGFEQSPLPDFSLTTST